MTEIRFFADIMVGKLARWLRVLGVDVLYSSVAEDDEIVRIAEAEDRIILTRDVGLHGRRMRTRCVLIDSTDYQEQIRQVIAAFDLKTFDVFSRCLECNTPLVSLCKEAAFERVPRFVYETQDRFATCPSCNRVYWHGTHVDRMLRRIAVGL
jgi:uncharacterized protein